MPQLLPQDCRNIFGEPSATKKWRAPVRDTPFIFMNATDQ